LNQEITFTLDENLFCIWIDFIHPERAYDPVFRYRLDCLDRGTMAIRAQFWFIREFGYVTPKERADFRMKWTGFYEGNQEKIESFAKELRIEKHTAFSRLISEIREQITLNANW